MVIESNLHKGKGIVRGDQFSIYRTVRGLPSGITLTAALLTIKDAIATADPGLIQKSITSSNVAGTGKIEDTGADGIGKIRFDLTTTNTLLMNADTEYYFDIQVTLSDGSILTLERGFTSANTQVGTS